MFTAGANVIRVPCAVAPESSSVGAFCGSASGSSSCLLSVSLCLVLPGRCSSSGGTTLPETSRGVTSLPVVVAIGSFSAGSVRVVVGSFVRVLVMTGSLAAVTRPGFTTVPASYEQLKDSEPLERHVVFVAYRGPAIFF